PPLVLRSYLDVVLEHDRLTVERERRERRVALERVENAVDDRPEPQPEHLERDVPLAVPVGVGDDEVTEIGGGGHGYDRSVCGSRSSSSTSTARSSTPARSSSPRCGTRRARSLAGSTPM